MARFDTEQEPTEEQRAYNAKALAAAMRGAAGMVAPTQGSPGAAAVAGVRSLLPGGDSYRSELAAYNDEAAPGMFSPRSAVQSDAPSVAGDPDETMAALGPFMAGPVKINLIPKKGARLSADEAFRLRSLLEREQRSPGYLDQTYTRAEHDALAKRQHVYGAERSANEIAAEKEAAAVAKTDKYLYHVAPADRLDAIMQEGLKPGAPSTVGRFGGYDSHSAGRLFLTDEGGVDFWRSRVQDHLADQMEHPPGVAVVKVPRDSVSVQPDPIGTRDAMYDAHYTTEPIPPDLIKPSRKRDGHWLMVPGAVGTSALAEAMRRRARGDEE